MSIHEASGSDHIVSFGVSANVRAEKGALLGRVARLISSDNTDSARSALFHITREVTDIADEFVSHGALSGAPLARINELKQHLNNLNSSISTKDFDSTHLSTSAKQVLQHVRNQLEFSFKPVYEKYRLATDEYNEARRAGANPTWNPKSSGEEKYKALIQGLHDLKFLEESLRKQSGGTSVGSAASSYDVSVPEDSSSETASILTECASDDGMEGDFSYDEALPIFRTDSPSTIICNIILDAVAGRVTSAIEHAKSNILPGNGDLAQQGRLDGFATQFSVVLDEGEGKETLLARFSSLEKEISIMKRQFPTSSAALSGLLSRIAEIKSQLLME